MNSLLVVVSNKIICILKIEIKMFQFSFRRQFPS